MTATCERSATYQEDGEGEIVIIHRRSRRSVINPLALVFLWALMAAFVAAAFVPPAAAEAGSRVRPVVSLSPPQLPESIAIGRRGDMYLSLNPLREILRITPDGKRSVFATIPAGSASLGVRLDASGNAYFAVPGSGVWRVPAGGGTPAELAPVPGAPNGIAFDARGDLLVANTTLGTIVRIGARPGGSAGRASVLAGPDCRLWGADGVAMDIRGNLYVAANAERDIVRVSPGGKLRVLASFAAGDPLYSPSDIAFGTGRRDRKQIFITNFAKFTGGTGAGVVTMNTGVPGQPLP